MILLALLLGLFLFPLPIAAQNSPETILLQTEYAVLFHSNIGPPLGLREMMWEYAVLPGGQGDLYQQSRFGAEVQLKETWGVHYRSQNVLHLTTNDITITFFRPETDGGTDSLHGPFLLQTEELHWAGPGLSYTREQNNYTWKLESTILIEGNYLQRSFVGNIEEQSATGLYTIRQALDPENSPLGLTFNAFFTQEQGEETLQLALYNVPGFLFWPEMIHRHGIFRYKDYEYDEEGYRIIPPTMLGRREYRSSVLMLSPRLEGEMTWPVGTEKARVFLAFPGPYTLQLHWPLSSGVHIIGQLPHPAAGLSYEGNNLKLSLWSSSLNPFISRNLGLSIQYRHTF